MGISKTRVIGLISAFLLLVLSYILLFINSNKLSQQALWMDHTSRIITNLELLALEYQSVEMSFRGYMATGHDIMKEKHFMAVTRTDSLYNHVRILVGDDDYQLQKLDTIRQLISTEFHNIRLAMDSAELVKPRLLNDYVATVGDSWLEPPQISRLIKQMEYYQGSLLVQRTETLRNFNDAIRIINLVSFVIAFILAAYSLNTYKRESKARQAAYQRSEQYKREIEGRIQDLADANKEIRELRNIEKFAATGRIARTIAHEVRNPLTNINLATEQVKLSLPENDDNMHLLDMISRNATRINQLISNLLAATKFSDLNFNQASINQLLDEAIELAKDRMTLQHVEVEKHYDSDACRSMVDEEKLKIAFLNIMVNALEAMEGIEGQNGLLRITTFKYETTCKITIEDNGPGMSEETASRLFEPFFSSKEKGGGLGLTNTQNIILNHKGTIEVESSLGLGTRFIVTLNTT